MFSVSPIVLRALYTVLFIATIILNALAASGDLGPLDQREISDMYPTFFTPAASAFSIWGLIYTLQAVFLVYVWTPAGRSDRRIDAGLSFLPCINYAANGAWTIAFAQEQFILSCFFMAVILGSLVWISVRGRLNYWPTTRSQRWPARTSSLDHHDDDGDVTAVSSSSFDYRFWLVAPAWSMYLGWIAVAAIANIFLTIVANDPSAKSPTFDNFASSAYAQGVATVLAVVALATHGDVIYAAVLVWALQWIAVKQADYAPVVVAARVCQIITGLLALVTLGALSRAAVNARSTGTYSGDDYYTNDERSSVLGRRRGSRKARR